MTSEQQPVWAFFDGLHAATSQRQAVGDENPLWGEGGVADLSGTSEGADRHEIRIGDPLPWEQQLSLFVQIAAADRLAGVSIGGNDQELLTIQRAEAIVVLREYSQLVSALETQVAATMDGDSEGLTTLVEALETVPQELRPALGVVAEVAFLYALDCNHEVVFEVKEQARQQLIETYQQMVRSVLRSAGRMGDDDDLQEGTIILADSLNRFEYARGNRFTTYGMTRLQWWAWGINPGEGLVSLDESIGDDSDLTVGDLVHDPAAGFVEEGVGRSMVVRQAADLLAEARAQELLTNRQYQVLLLHWGLSEEHIHQQLSFSEIARLFAVDPTRVQQIYSTARRKLFNFSKSKDSVGWQLASLVLGKSPEALTAEALTRDIFS